MADDHHRPTTASTQQALPTNERRGDARRRVFKSGTIEFGSEALPCTVRNLSSNGACIEVNSPLWYPDRFVLAVDGERHACHVVWKRERRIGLGFA